MKKLDFKTHVRLWFMVVGTATLVLGAAYGLVQQSTRIGATDAPHRTADMAKQLLNKGAQPSAVIPNYTAYLPEDSSTFLTITDKSGNVLGSNLVLAGTEQTIPPQGVFNNAAARGYDSVTWQPKSDIRAVIYVEPYNNGFVVAGQSLKPFENRYRTYAAIAATAWLAVVIWVTLLALI